MLQIITRDIKLSCSWIKKIFNVVLCAYNIDGNLTTKIFNLKMEQNFRQK